ncbi:MAG: antitoxin family protein [Pyrinomonadaceae bacterium]
MSQRVRAIYQNGAFIPQVPYDLPDGSEVELTVHRSNVLPPKTTDPDERKRIINRMIERMLSNPIPANSPRFTREELHERR